MRVKLCGICRPADAALAAAVGADYLGVILSRGFARSREPLEAATIYAAAGTLRRAGVFVDEARATVEAAVARFGLHVIQLHGAEPPALARALRRPDVEVWKALRPRAAEELLAAALSYVGAADALLLDGAGAGGTGARFDWEAVAEVRARLPAELRLVVAGGLTPVNVAEAVRRLRPDVVDVSSGVEAAPGEKSPQAVRAFVAAARAAAAALGAAGAGPRASEPEGER